MLTELLTCPAALLDLAGVGVAALLATGADAAGSAASALALS